MSDERKWTTPAQDELLDRAARVRHAFQNYIDGSGFDAKKIAEALPRAIADLEEMRSRVRAAAATLVHWAVAAGGHTPSAIMAKELRRIIGDEPPLVMPSGGPVPT